MWPHQATSGIMTVTASHKSSTHTWSPSSLQILQIGLAACTGFPTWTLRQPTAAQLPEPNPHTRLTPPVIVFMLDVAKSAATHHTDMCSLCCCARTAVDAVQAVTRPLNLPRLPGLAHQV